MVGRVVGYKVRDAVKLIVWHSDSAFISINIRPVYCLVLMGG